MEVNELLRDLVQFFAENKCSNIVVLDVSEVCSFVEFFIICDGLASTHVEMVAKDVIVWLKKRRIKIKGSSNTVGSTWSLVDCGNMFINIFSPSTRKIYDLESLWSNAKIVNI